MKSFKIVGFGPRKRKSGFTLIELLIVMVIIAILAGVIVMAVGGVFGTAKTTAYATAREQIQAAVGAYAAANSGSIPTLTGTSTVNSTYVTVINISALVTTNSSSGLLRTVPTGVYGGTATNGSDNCATLGNASTGCSTSNHYIWYVDNGSSVLSACTGTGCLAANTSGYQGVWP